MFEANLKIIQELKDFVSIISQNPDILKNLSNVPNAFTRNRKLPFERLVLLIAKLCKKTLSVEIDSFFEEMELSRPCSVSAFSQQRMKLNPTFFTLWNELLCASYYYYYGSEVKRWKGYRLVAGDGSNISLVSTPELTEYFGGQRNQEKYFVQAKTFYCYDILNELVLSSKIAPYRMGELKMSYSIIDNLQEDMIMIYDRNFCNYKTIALHLWKEKEVKFVIRAKERQSTIKEFVKSGVESAVAYLPSTPSAIVGLQKSGYKINKKTLLKVRLVRVQLEKSIEVLITNLWEEEGYSHQEFSALYFKRWGIETNISLQKNNLQLESFSGLSPLSVQQDFYATVFITNLYSLMIKDAQQTVSATKTKTKYPMKINRNKAYGKLRKNLVAIFINEKPETILKLLHQYFIRDTLPIRNNRSFPRVVKNKQSNSKHKTFMNYKPAF